MLVYIEYISRLPGVSLEAFHYVAGRGQEGWAGEYEEDRLILNVGRTFRTGPEPEYLAAWYTPDAGPERVGEWERVFKSGVADHVEEPFKLAGRIDRAGCYDPLLEPIRVRDGLYYGEYFDLARGASRSDVRSFFSARRERSPELELNLLVDRIGLLGPDPRGIAFWTLPTWDALDSVARELDGVEAPIRLVTAGVYRDLGQETL